MITTDQKYNLGFNLGHLSFNSLTNLKGFNGQETDNEWRQRAVSFEYRVHDARLGRFLSVDPLYKKYPHYSPYMFAGNKVINSIDYEGLEEYETCPRFGHKNRRGAWLKMSLFVTRQSTVIVKEPKSEQKVKPRSNRDLNKKIKVKFSATITFDAYTVPDQITVTDDQENQVITTPQDYSGQQTWTVNNTNPDGELEQRFDIDINANSNPTPANQGTNTNYLLTIQINEQEVVRKTRYKFLGITYKTETKRQWVDPTNTANKTKTQVTTRWFGFRTDRWNSNVNIDTENDYTPRKEKGKKKKIWL